MRPDLEKILLDLSLEELNGLLSETERLIREKTSVDLGRRKHKRIGMNLQASCEVEREKEFFDREHKICIRDLSASGLRFQASEPLLVNDLIMVYFRSPSNGAQKKIDCRVVRVEEAKNKARIEYHISAQAVGKDYVKKYKDWLSKRSAFLSS